MTGRIVVKCPNCGQRETVSTIPEEITNLNCPKCDTSMKIQEHSACILQEASKIINGERLDSYGKPEDSFQIIAEFWTIYLKYRGLLTKDPNYGLSSLDVAHMMALFKEARLLGQHQDRDNYRDAVGYLAIAADRLIRWPEEFDSEEL